MRKLGGSVIFLKCFTKSSHLTSQWIFYHWKIWEYWSILSSHLAIYPQLFTRKCLKFLKSNTSMRFHYLQVLLKYKIKNLLPIFPWDVFISSSWGFLLENSAEEQYHQSLDDIPQEVHLIAGSNQQEDIQRGGGGGRISIVHSPPFENYLIIGKKINFL